MTAGAPRRTVSSVKHFNPPTVAAARGYSHAVQVFDNPRAVLAAGGAGFADVVKLGFYLRDFAELDAVREVRDQYVDTANPPASTAIAVVRLARPEFLIEVDAIAVLP